MICITLSGKTLAENVRIVEKNIKYIDICELRMDFLTDEERMDAHLFPKMVKVPVILTYRRLCDGAQNKVSEKIRQQALVNALKGKYAFIDIEEDVKNSEAEEFAKKKNVKIIRSYHNFEEVPGDIFAKIQSLSKKGDIAKVAVTPKSINDVVLLFKIQQELEGVDKIIIGMGDYGVCTRILYKKMGSMLTFCANEEIAPGQISPKTMKELYRADKVNENTGIYGIIGNPVLHSASPLIHNPGFHAINYNAIYLPFLVDNVRSFFALAEMLKMRGFSVTIPFKLDVLSYCGKITREVKQIGSCNTVIRQPGLWKGINTDYYGFLVPIQKQIESGKIKSALVIGAGGAAQAIIWALRNSSIKVTIINRTIENAEKLATQKLCSYDSLDNAKKYEGKVDLIVQTTSVGGVGSVGVSPIEGFKFTGKEVVYDIIYKPKMTKLLQDAKDAGCRLIYGKEMLLNQGVLQFENFTGYHFPSNVKPEL